MGTWWFGTIWDKLFGFHHISLLLDFPFICLYLVYYIMVLFSIIYGIILLIDKLIFFKMVKLNHQTRKTLETFSGSMGSMLVGGMVFCSFFDSEPFLAQAPAVLCSLAAPVTMASQAQGDWGGCRLGHVINSCI